MSSRQYDPNDPKQKPQDIADRFAVIREFLKGVDRDAFLHDKKTQYAVAKAIEEICEAAYWFLKSKNGEELRTKYGDVNFQVFGDAGNIIRHAYWGVDYGRLWDDLHGGSDIAALEDMLGSEIPFYRPLFGRSDID